MRIYGTQVFRPSDRCIKYVYASDQFEMCSSRRARPPPSRRPSSGYPMDVRSLLLSFAPGGGWWGLGARLAVMLQISPQLVEKVDFSDFLSLALFVCVLGPVEPSKRVNFAYAFGQQQHQQKMQCTQEAHRAQTKTATHANKLYANTVYLRCCR